MAVTADGNLICKLGQTFMSLVPLRNFSSNLSSSIILNFHKASTYRNLLLKIDQKRAMATAMAKRLEGKTILITGASSGIGKSTGCQDRIRLEVVS